MLQVAGDAPPRAQCQPYAEKLSLAGDNGAAAPCLLPFAVLTSGPGGRRCPLAVPATSYYHAPSRRRSQPRRRPHRSAAAVVFGWLRPADRQMLLEVGADLPGHGAGRLQLAPRHRQTDAAL